MSRTRQFLLIPIVILTFLTSCTAKGGNQLHDRPASRATVGDYTCYEEAGFCAIFPSGVNSEDIAISYRPSKGLIPPHTSYSSWAFPADDVEKYTVYVADEPFVLASGLMQGGGPISCGVDLETDPALHAMICASNGGTYLKVIGMFVTVGDQKYYVEAANASGTEPKYFKIFLESFKPSP